MRMRDALAGQVAERGGSREPPVYLPWVEHEVPQRGLRQGAYAQKVGNPSGFNFPAAYLAHRMRKGAYVIFSLALRGVVPKSSGRLHPNFLCVNPTALGIDKELDPWRNG
jgi:hypothetical protein